MNKKCKSPPQWPPGVADRSSGQVKPACPSLLFKSWLHPVTVAFHFVKGWTILKMCSALSHQRHVTCYSGSWLSPGRNTLWTHSVSALLLVSSVIYMLTEKNPLDSRNLHRPKFNFQVPIGCLFSGAAKRSFSNSVSSQTQTDRAGPDMGHVYIQNKPRCAGCSMPLGRTSCAQGFPNHTFIIKGIVSN